MLCLMNEGKVIEEAKQNITPAITFSFEDIAKITDLFSILIKIDRKVGKVNEKNNDRKRTGK